jgi:multidrug efflux pump subunit AcrA (membrane-fusion protein)
MSPEPLFRIAIDNDIELEAEVPSIRQPALAPGQTARVEIGADRELSGRVRLVPARSINAPKSAAPEFRWSAILCCGSECFARATIDANRSCGISVPRSAVRYRTEGTSVQVVRNDAIETRLVQVGFHSDNDTEIRSGLQEGDMIVANAGSSLRDGDKVTPIVADAARMGQR